MNIAIWQKVFCCALSQTFLAGMCLQQIDCVHGQSAVEKTKTSTPFAVENPIVTSDQHTMETLIAISPKPITLTSNPVCATLIPNPKATDEKKSLRSCVENLTPNHRLYVVLRGLQVHSQPGVLYALYLDLLPQTSPEPNDARYIGSLNFFNVPSSADAKLAPSPSKVFQSYDITKTARTLYSSNMLSNSTTLTIIPTGVPEADAMPVVGRVELVEQ